MAFRTHSLLRSRKAQFFIVSATAIVIIIFFVSRWLEPYTIVDTSSIALREEFYIFDDIVEKIKETVRTSKNCEELKYNLEEYKNFVDKFAAEKNYKIYLYYTIANCPEEAVPAPPASPTVVAFNLFFESDSVSLQSSFSCGWPAGCPV